jgi:uncharacterized membrane protein
LPFFRNFNKIGAVALIIGMGFFLKYAFDNHWISPWIQVLFGFLVSGGLLYAASKFFKQEAFKNFSQGLSGAGIAISYLSTFAAFNFYHLINDSSAFILLCVSTVVALTQALKYDSMAVAILGLIGGFITPLMLSFQAENPLGLYSYLVFVNGLVVALLIKKERWKPLEYMGILATYVIYFLSHGLGDTTVASALFLAILGATYTGLDVYRLSQGKATSIYTAILNGILFYSGVGFLCSSATELATATGSISLLYLGLGVGVYKQFKAPEGYLKQNILAAILLLTVAVDLAWSGFPQVIAWAIEAFAILWLGVKYAKGYVWKSALGVFILAIIALLVNQQTLVYEPLQTFVPILNFRVLTFAVLGGLLALSAKKLATVEQAKGISGYIKFCLWTLLFLLFSLETNDFMGKLASSAGTDAAAMMIHFNNTMIQTLVWCSFATGLVKAGIQKVNQAVTLTGLAGMGTVILSLLIMGTTFSPLENFIPVINLRFAAFGLIATGVFYVTTLIKGLEQKPSWLNGVKTVFTYVGCTLLFVLLNSEISDYFAKQAATLGGITEGLSFNKEMILGVGCSLMALPLIKNGLANKNVPLVVFGGISIGLAFIIGVWHGFTFTPIEQYFPFFNLRVLLCGVLSVALIYVAQWLKQTSASQSAYRYIRLIQLTLSLLIFGLLTVEIKDLFAKEILLLSNTGAAEGDGKLAFLSNVKQLTISTVWLLYSIGLMVWGIVKKIKPIRYTALALLAISILKVFIIDLAFLGQFYRIISFMGLGVIMLMLSYFYQKYNQQINRLLQEESKAEISDDNKQTD